MTVAELIEWLKKCDPDQEVHFAYPSGDYWRTKVSEEVGNVNEKLVSWSEYHRKYAIAKNSDSTDDKTIEVVLLEA